MSPSTSLPTQAQHSEPAAPMGYRHPQYARSLAEFGTPHELVRCGGWILERQIHGVPYYDGMGCYPLFSCKDWSGLKSDLEELEDLVALSIVTDPFGTYTIDELQHCFPDRCFPFKDHFTIDLEQPIDRFVESHHRRYARKALEHICVEQCVEPDQYLDDWINLYNNLIVRHDIKGISAFSRSAFSIQLSIPGIVAFQATHQGDIVGMLLWYVQDGVGYYHLGAYSSTGYDLRASFALFWFAIDYFAKSGLRWLNLGAGAGVDSDGTDGLTRFKRGWSTGTRRVYFCGRIFDPERYYELVKAKRMSETDYFPAYRKGEYP
jgi:hypothetical protein